jgi:hypothetical protein
MVSCVECGKKYPFIPEQLVCHACDLEAMGFHVRRLVKVLHDRGTSTTVPRKSFSGDHNEES